MRTRLADLNLELKEKLGMYADIHFKHKDDELIQVEILLPWMSRYNVFTSLDDAIKFMETTLNGLAISN